MFFVSVASERVSATVSHLESTLAGMRISVAFKGLDAGRLQLETGKTDRAVPKWEEYPHTPGVFVRVANKGLTGYGTWKSLRKMGGTETGGWQRMGRAGEAARKGRMAWDLGVRRRVERKLTSQGVAKL